MKITHRQLLVFATIYRTGATTQAAVELGLSQSAISTALTQLEEHLGTKLFERIGKRLLINNEGKLLYPKVISLLSQIQEIETLFNDESGTLRIGASTTIGNYVLPEIIFKFTQQYPKIKISLHVHNSQDICEGLHLLNYDIGFIEAKTHHENLRSQFWCHDEMVLFCASNSRFAGTQNEYIDLEDIANAPLILREKGSGTRETVDNYLLKQLPSPPEIIELGNSEAIKRAVLYDSGIGCLSVRTLEDLVQLKKIKILQLKQIKLEREFSIVLNHEKFETGIMKRFIRCCQGSQNH